ncbi:MAG: sigma-70 family RNA polymerase sigma factor [Chloroflexota bacterium]|nr:sigma-70 family RNA polymerase sigma factor [Chloroflexota bacterium]
MTPEQEHECIQRAQKEPRAFVHLYDHYFPRIHAYVRYRVHSPQDAEDLIADVFFKAIRKLGHFKWRNKSSFAAWLFRIAHNMIVDYYRQQKHQVSVESRDNLMELPSHALLPEQVLTQQETFQQIRALVATLSPWRQEIITLKFFGGLRNCEIAQILGLDERTVAAHLSRGLQNLQHKYAAQVLSEAMVEEAV